MKWLAKIKKNNKGKNNKEDCISQIANNNYNAEFFGIYSDLDEKQKVIIDILYDYCNKNNIDKNDFEKVGIRSSLDKHSSKTDITYFNFILKFADNPEKLKHLLEKMPSIFVLKYVIDEKYSYDEIINIICPYYSKMEYIHCMKDKKYTCEQMKYCIENKIFLPVYHDKFDYDKIDDIIEKENFIFENDERLLLYKLDFYTLSKLIQNCDKSVIIEILSKFSYAPIETLEIRTEIIPLLIEKCFTVDELITFFFVLEELDKLKISEIKLFLNVSTKEELFRKLFELFVNN